MRANSRDNESPSSFRRPSKGAVSYKNSLTRLSGGLSSCVCGMTLCVDESVSVSGMEG